MARRRRHKLASYWRRLKPWLMPALKIGAMVLVVLPPLGALIFSVVPAPLTVLMIVRLAEGQGMVRTPVPLSRISPLLIQAVIASEDSQFCIHNGFDWKAIDKAVDSNAEGGAMRGASTISQQTVKNLFLWPGRDWIRKGLEAYTTVFVETFWSKRRIMETYLNIIEWGPGIYGAQAAARFHFGKDAAELTADEAARLAVILPDPRHWRPNPAGPFVRKRAPVIEARMGQVRQQGLARCVLGHGSGGGPEPDTLRQSIDKLGDGSRENE